MKNILQALSLFLALTFVTGVLYPLGVTLLGITFFSKKVKGSLIENNGSVVGSELIAQNFKSDRYFWPRPSASNFETLPSGGSNFSQTSLAFKEVVLKRRSQFSEPPPPDLLLASGSGLDPHIRVESALFQAPRVASARKISNEQVEQAIWAEAKRENQLFLGQSQLVNVLKLNLSLDTKRDEKRE